MTKGEMHDWQYEVLRQVEQLFGQASHTKADIFWNVPGKHDEWQKLSALRKKEDAQVKQNVVFEHVPH